MALLEGCYEVSVRVQEGVERVHYGLRRLIPHNRGGSGERRNQEESPAVFKPGASESIKHLTVAALKRHGRACSSCHRSNVRLNIIKAACHLFSEWLRPARLSIFGNCY